MNQMKSFMDRCNKLIQSYKPTIPIYFNGITNLSRQNNLKYNLFDYNTKQDLEDLPTTWGGYDIFPYRSKFFAADGKQVVAMSGKFHAAWGEFGGFKHRDALLYEAASMAAFGANVNIGDQLHPSGKMDMATYENIGYAFDYVKKIEDYGVGALHASRLGFFNPLNSQSGEGIVRMMLENQVNFNVINRMADWSELEAIVYCSHRNTPNKLENAEHPAIIRKGNIVYIAHALDLMYFNMGARVHRDLFNSALQLVNEHPMIKADLPCFTRPDLQGAGLYLRLSSGL